MMKATNALMILCSLVFLAMPPLAVSAELPQALLDCVRENDDVKRLACYDRYAATVAGEGDTLAGATPEHDETITPPSAPATGNGPSVDVDAFGMTGELARRNRPADEPVAPESINARINRIVEKPRGERIVYLDNDQVWEERTRARGLTLKVDDVVMIEAAALGSFRLVGPDGNHSTGVRRIQ